MEEVKKNNTKNIAYLLIGVLTLIIATTGATFAYFTATDDETSVITGNMASITFTLNVDKMTTADDDLNRGLIPMSNSMVESAVSNASVNNQGICLDDNGNAVCQIYKITVANTGTASMLLDGYVTLTGGSGTPTDLVGTNNVTTMRWSQVFCDETSGTISNCTTAGKTTTTATKSDNGVTNGITTNWSQIQNTGTATDSGFNRTQILTSGITTKAMIAGSEYDVINTNFIRISDHASAAGYTQTADITSALIYNEFLNAQDETTNPVGGSGTGVSYTDSQVYYIVIWLSETGTNQTGATAADREQFFTGTVKFVSAQGSEVTATFSGYTAVRPDTLPSS